MCGICVIGKLKAVLEHSVLETMTMTLAHRGPDAQGVIVLESKSLGAIGFGHCRLSIIDLDARSEQPMVSASKMTWITFNGEIYNYAELREELIAGGMQFNTESDTEVILNGYEMWGEDVFHRLNGMFALALWDSETETLLAARDRLGKKPLYYTIDGDGFIFSSQLKAILANPEFHPELDVTALNQYFVRGYIPGTRTIFCNVFKLLPGHYLKLNPNQSVQVRRFWDPIIYYQNAFQGDEYEAEEKLELLLTDAVKLRMISDVPLGALLSGGIDSSLIVALMQEQSLKPVQTFTIGFNDERYDESHYANQVGSFLGTDHHELYVTESNLLDFVLELVEYFDEPFADMSAIPTYAVSRMARQHVTVALSGDGGDELFLGYPTYQWMERRELFRQVFPPFLGIASKILSTLPQRQASKFGRYLQINSPLDAHNWVTSYWEPSQMGKFLMPSLRSSADYYEQEEAVFECLSKLPLLQRLSAVDLTSYMVDDILIKVDRASMAIALELRASLLDYRVVEFVASLPLELKRKSSCSKYLLRKILYKRIPRHIVDRPKKGFNVPMAKWLRGPLRDVLRRYADPIFLQSQGIFHQAEITKQVDEHLTEKSDHAKRLWAFIVFQMWFEHYSIKY